MGKLTMKTLLVASITLASLSVASANGWESSGYNKPIVSEKFGFSAVYNNGSVVSKWTPYIKNDGEAFKYFKLVASNNNVNPVYPEDGYVTYSSDKDFSTYTDSAPKPGANWYRICAIYEKNRICSPVAKVVVPGEGIIHETRDIKKEDYKEPKEIRIIARPVVQTGVIIDAATKASLDGLISNFKTNLEAKFSSNAECIAKIDAVIAKANAIKNPSRKLKAYLRYIVEQLQNLRDSYDDTTGTISDILKTE